MRETGKELTIYDIAKMAGVSPATVSRVLTSSANVSFEKKKKVEKIIAKYNFRPNAIARSLSDANTKTIGVMAADIRNPYYAILVVACEEAANRRGYTLLLSNILDDHEKEFRNLEKFYEQRVDAIIQIGRLTDDLLTDEIYATRVNEIISTIPFVTTGNLLGVDCYRLNIDNEIAMRGVMEYLISLGHKEIAFIGGRLTVASTYEKWQQYIYLLGQNNLPFREEYFQEGDYSIASGKRCMDALLQGEHRPTAIVAVNDYTAVGAAKKLQEKGFSIPEDMSLVSFDNTFLTEIATPNLTSVDYNYAQYGEKLISIAIDAAHGKEVPRRQLINPTLVKRNSCAAPNTK